MTDSSFPEMHILDSAHEALMELGYCRLSELVNELDRQRRMVHARLRLVEAELEGDPGNEALHERQKSLQQEGAAIVNKLGFAAGVQADLYDESKDPEHEHLPYIMRHTPGGGLLALLGDLLS